MYAKGYTTEALTSAHQRTDVFLTRLKFKNAMKETEDCKAFCIDFFAFHFDVPMKGEMYDDFLSFIGTLDLTRRKAMMCICVYLRKHGIPFRLRFRYNTEAPFIYNVSNLLIPRRMQKKAFSTSKKSMDAITDEELAAFVPK